jgi:hypothetical protein
MEELINIIKKIRYKERQLINSSSLSEEELHYILREYRNLLREFDKYSELVELIEKIDFL